MDDMTDICLGIYGPAPLSSCSGRGPFVYYIQCGAFVKIGTSVNPEKRVDQIRRGGKAKRPSIWVGDPELLPDEVAA